MGSGGHLFAGALKDLARAFQAENPEAHVETRHHWDVRAVPSFCKNPLLVGHSLGAIRAVEIGNQTDRGRVISIDPPRVSLYSRLPTVNFYNSFSFLGGGTVTGSARNVNLSSECITHLLLAGSRTVYEEVLRTDK